MEAPRRPGDAAAEERWRKLQEYLAAKGKLKQPSAKPYLKDKTSRQNLAPSKPEPIVRCHIPGMSRNAQIRKAKWAVPADQSFSGKRPVPPVPSKLSTKKHSEKQSSTASPAKHHLRRLRKSESLTAHGLANRSRVLKDCQEKVERDQKNARAKIVPQLQKSVRPGLRPQVSSKQASETSRQTVGSHVPGKTQAWTNQAAETRVRGKDKEPPADCKELGGPQRRVHGISMVWPPSQLGQSSAVSRPVVRSQGQLPRTMKQSMMTPQAAGVLGQGEPLTGRKNTAQSVRTAFGILKREPSTQQADCRQALQERWHPNASVEMRRKLKLTPGGIHSGACGDIDRNRSTAERNQRSKMLQQMPRTGASESGHAVGSLRHGRNTPKSRQTVAGAGRVPKTPRSQDRRALLDQWLASRGKCYKRPPMTLPARRPQEKKESRNVSFWSCTEEEKAVEEKQLSLTNEVVSLLAECQKLAEEGFSSEELLAMLSRIPEAERFAQFWICKARLLAQQGTFDAAGLYEAAACAGAVPLQDLWDVIVDLLKNTSETGWAIPVEARLFSAEEQAKTSTQSTVQGSTAKPITTIKLQVVPLFRAKEPSNGPDLKLLTPVRRSLRIEQAVARYPRMLKDHDPVVFSLDEIMDNRSRFVFRNNDALPEEVEAAEFVTAFHSLGQRGTQQP